MSFDVDTDTVSFSMEAPKDLNLKTFFNEWYKAVKEGTFKLNGYDIVLSSLKLGPCKLAYVFAILAKG